MTPRRAVTVTILRDGDLSSTSFRIPVLVYRAALGLLIAIGLLLILALGYLGPIARQAARVPALRREIERLTGDNRRIRELALALDSVEAQYAKLRALVGADIAPDPVLLASALLVAPPITVGVAASRPRYEMGPSVPRHWPLDERGYLTRGQIGADSTPAEAHPGIDVAVPVGALVRCAGGGTILQVGEDREYGQFVLVQHPNGYQSMYGHLSRVVVLQGARIRAGEVLGRTGNTGRSSAPHLHLEIRHNGVTLDPLTLIREPR